MRDRRLGLAALAIGALAILAVQRIAPLLAPPLYDGVVVVEPYRWLVPPPGEPGDPTSASGTARISGGTSPLVALATNEVPPQAQIFAAPGALVLPGGATSVSMSITPVPAQVQPAGGHVAGNVYRISVTDQSGTALTGPSSAKVTVVLRGPDSEPFVTIEQLTFQGWKPLKTEDAGFGSTYLAVVTSFGDFALIASGPSASAEPTAGGSPSGSGAAPTEVASAPANSGGSPGGRPSAPTPSSAPGAAGSRSAGPPVALIAGAVALCILLAIGVASIRQRDRQRRSQRGRRRR